MTGIDYPTISVGKHENLVVRYSLAAQLLMRRRGIDPAQLHILTCPFLVRDDKLMQEPNPDAVQNVLTAFSCMVAENFLTERLPGVLDLNSAPTGDYWATLLDGRLPDAEAAVAGALGKAAEARRKKLQAVAPPGESLAS